MLTLSHALTRHGHDCTIAAFENLHRPNLEIVERAGTFQLPVQLVRCSGRLDWRAVSRLRRMMRQGNIDVVHAHGYKADVYAYLASRGTSAATVSTCHNWIHQGLATAIYNRLDRLVLRRFDAIVAVSDTVANILGNGGGCGQKVRVINNGIDLSRFAAATPTLREEFGADYHGPLVGFVGRLSPEKGPQYLVRAAADVLRYRPDAKFVLVGSGPERERLQKAVASLGIEGSVRFVGQRADMPSVYASLDVIVLPSVSEGLPLTILEALAAKRAVVASDVGGVPSIVIHEKTGLLVPPGDVPALAASIERLLDDACLRRQLGCSGYDLVKEHYSATTMAERYSAVYRDALVARAHAVGGAARDVSSRATRGTRT
ncbi:MAG: glycosyltransferase family 4 protein [Acidobacteriia bacterium]|nr:glycosyltransferase family 4 protein [Terriglobia bacterium]